jgi:hypothetical protein
LSFVTAGGEKRHRPKAVLQGVDLWLLKRGEGVDLTGFGTGYNVGVKMAGHPNVPRQRLF